LKGLDFTPKADDVLIVTSPKCGTTWMQQIVHQLRSNGSMDYEEISSVVPWIELAHDLGQDLDADQGFLPRAFKTHCCYDHCPKVPPQRSSGVCSPPSSLPPLSSPGEEGSPVRASSQQRPTHARAAGQAAGAKYIVVVRDPHDVAVSFFSFFEGWFFAPGEVALEEFVREFWLARGAPASRMNNASYFHHLTSWWPHRRPPPPAHTPPSPTLRRPARAARGSRSADSARRAGRGTTCCGCSSKT